jgi:carnitine O-acetyltransferase
LFDDSLAKGSINHGEASSAAIEPPKKLLFDLSPQSLTAIKAATVQFDALAAKHDLQVVTFEGYGKSLIKKFSVSPDAYAQMAIQLAYYKLYGYSGATYESAGTRKFIHGRTETGKLDLIPRPLGIHRDCFVGKGNGECRSFR